MGIEEWLRMNGIGQYGGTTTGARWDFSESPEQRWRRKYQHVGVKVLFTQRVLCAACGVTLFVWEGQHEFVCTCGVKLRRRSNAEAPM